MEKLDNKLVFSDHNIQNLPPVPVEKQTVDYWDKRVPGLYLRLYPTGARVFYFRWKKADKSRRERLGVYPDLSIEGARKTARELASEVEAIKEDAPLRSTSKSITFEDLFEIYMSEYAELHTKTPRQTREFYRRDFQSFRDKPVADITPDHIQTWVNSMAEQLNNKGQPKRATAQRSLEVFKAVIKYGLRKRHIQCQDPTEPVDGFKLVPRDRYLLTDEFKRLKEQLNSYGAQVVNGVDNRVLSDFFWTCLYTGARQANVASMEWGELNLAEGLWHIPPSKSKNGLKITLPLMSWAVELLEKRRKIVTEDCPWVFPSPAPRKSKSGHLEEPKNAWRTICKRAQIEDFRPHDLRHTVGSYMAMSNTALPMIGKALGHASTAATKRYAHLAADPVRQQMEKALGFMAPEPQAEKAEE